MSPLVSVAPGGASCERWCSRRALGCLPAPFRESDLRRRSPATGATTLSAGPADKPCSLIELAAPEARQHRRCLSSLQTQPRAASRWCAPTDEDPGLLGVATVSPIGRLTVRTGYLALHSHSQKMSSLGSWPPMVNPPVAFARRPLSRPCREATIFRHDRERRLLVVDRAEVQRERRGSALAHTP